MRDLGDGFTLRAMTQEEFQPLWDKHYPAVFGNKARLRLGMIFSDTERANMENLAKYFGSPLCLRLGLFDRDRFVGWHLGDQKSREEFYMRNTGILPDYQGQGLYGKMLRVIRDHLTELGFQVISSKHHTTNNRVIIPKLKIGFVITGMEVSDKFGTMVRLEYFTNAKRRAVLDYRVGESLPSAELKGALGLD
jgi:RimJ/RimL family protein N-acetyltransferase